MNLKALIEQRNAKLAEANALIAAATTETRAFTEDEKGAFDTLEGEIRALNDTIAAIQSAAKMSLADPAPVDEKNGKKETNEQLEERAFAEYLRGTINALETRADVNMVFGDNGAVVPSTIANKIIVRVLEICPIYQMATRYNIKGALSIPYYDEKTQAITMAYADEFVDLQSTSGKFASIELKGFLSGVLTKVSKMLINNSQFDIVSFVINAMAQSIARWIEGELLNGTAGKIAGLDAGITQIVTAAATTAVTSDELIDLQESIPDVFQAGAVWLMAKSTRTAIRKLKDGDGNYLLNKDATSKWGYTLFGKDVYISDNIGGMVAGGTAIYYGDMTGLAVKVADEMNITVLNELFAIQHVTGIVGWMEIDSKVENAQKLSKLIMAAS